MSQEQNNLATEIINKEKWWDILSRFIEVLRINIFILDPQGQVILPPEVAKYGGRLLTDGSLKYDLPQGTPQFIEKFDSQGPFREFAGRYQLFNYAIPVTLPDRRVIAYMIMGPIVFNKTLDRAQYTEMAREAGVNPEALMDEIWGIRVVSNVMIKSILDLLAEIVDDNVELALREKQQLSQNEKKPESDTAQEIRKASDEIFSTVQTGELLVTLLDLALNLTKAECGSVMVLDDAEKYLTIKAARGMNEERVEKTKVKLGEGIAGLAAKENTTFMIRGQEVPDSRLANYVKRPEITSSFVMPLVSKEHVFGVLNLHTTSKNGEIEKNVENLKSLSKLLSSAF